MCRIWSVFAGFFALSHFALIVLLIIGGPLALRWSWMPALHIPAAILTGAVFAVGADCPLTTWQKFCLRRAGRTPYNGGFIEHYLVEPVTGGAITSTTKAVILLTWIVPTVLGYAMLLRKRRRVIDARVLTRFR